MMPSSAPAFDLRPATGSPGDLALYADLVVAGMEPDDAHAPDEYGGMLADGRLLAWWAVGEDGVLGWCALAPRHGGYLPGAWHLYGAWVRPDARGRGVARSLWERRLALVPVDADVTVSIQPGKPGSVAIARSLGFVELGVVPPWTNFVRRAPRPASTSTGGVEG